jgi:glycosyltransferase involved in cell wall biosynthesis
VPDFVHAVAIARKTQPELVGLIAGEGPDRPAVKRAGASVGEVQLLGHRDDVPRLMCAADIFVLVSDFEAVPMAILEAMAVGLPVVATSVGGIPDLITDGEAGLLVPPRDPAAIAASLAMLAGDPALRASLGSAAAERHRRRWTAEKMIEGYANVLWELRAERSAGAVSRRTSVPATTNRKL